MDLDSFLAAPKWDILEIIAHRPSSPIEIAEVTKTTVSYVSQQLKLLEAVGIVKKTKTGAFLKGKPRSVYSISEDFMYLNVLGSGLSGKKKVTLDPHKRVVSRIWMLDNQSIHLDLEKIFLELNPHLENITGAYLDVSKTAVDLKFILKNNSDKTKISTDIKKSGVKATVSFVSESEAIKLYDSLYILFDPLEVLRKGRDNVKGGNNL